MGDLLDWGYSFGFFAILEPRGAAAFTREALADLTGTYRCHGRFGGFMIAKNVSGSDGTSADFAAAAAGAAALRTVARGWWLLPFATTSSGDSAVSLGDAGVALAAPAVPRQGVMARTAQEVAQAIAQKYGWLHVGYLSVTHRLHVDYTSLHVGYTSVTHRLVARGITQDGMRCATHARYIR